MHDKAASIPEYACMAMFYTVHSMMRIFTACTYAHRHHACRIDEMTAERIRMDAAFMTNLSSEYVPQSKYATYICRNISD